MSDTATTEKGYISLSATEVSVWRRTVCPKDIAVGIRVGQSFYNYFKLNAVTSAANREFLDRIHAADGQYAHDLIESITDFMQ